MIVQLEEAKQTLGTLAADVAELRDALDYDTLAPKQTNSKKSPANRNSGAERMPKPSWRN